MGRKIRMVPPNWQHPMGDRSNGRVGKLPLYDQDVESAWAEWQEEYAAWLAGGHDETIAKYGDEYPKDEPYRAFCNWHGGPPNPKYYRPKWQDGQATWFQVYETVSEGTPVSPPFATQAELVEYLVTNGDEWDQARRREGRGSVMDCSPWSRKSAESFVYGSGWAPSMVMDANGPRRGVDL